jgi:hypothetical protein
LLRKTQEAASSLRSKTILTRFPFQYVQTKEKKLGILQSVEPVLESAVKTLQKVVDFRAMGRK